MTRTLADHLLTDQELCQLLRVTRQWTHKARRHFGLPFLKIGKHVRYRRREVEAWLRDKTVSEPKKARTGQC